MVCYFESKNTKEKIKKLVLLEFANVWHFSRKWLKTRHPSAVLLQTTGHPVLVVTVAVSNDDAETYFKKQ